jgi:thioredoxin reductase
VELPLWGKLRFLEATKEQLLATWENIITTTGLEVKTGEKMVDIMPLDEMFRVRTTQDEYITRAVVLALGRRGIPRKLNVPGEEMAKVVYQLIDAESYANMDLLVVGGGDSAIEAAIALAMQKTNRVTLSYRQSEFTKIKERNTTHLQDMVRRGRLTLAMSSVVQEIQQYHVILATPEGRREVKNDQVFVCIGGELPFEFLSRIGIDIHRQLVENPHTA